MSIRERLGPYLLTVVLVLAVLSTLGEAKRSKKDKDTKTKKGAQIETFPRPPPFPLPQYVPKSPMSPPVYVRKLIPNTYNPYECLPKYICILPDAHGRKKMTVVNALHPILRAQGLVKNQDESALQLTDFVAMHQYAEQMRDREQNDAFLHQADNFEGAIFSKPPPTPKPKPIKKKDEDTEAHEDESSSSSSSEEGQNFEAEIPYYKSDIESSENEVKLENRGFENVATVPWNDENYEQGTGKYSTSSKEQEAGIVSKFTRILLPTFFKRGSNSFKRSSGGMLGGFSSRFGGVFSKHRSKRAVPIQSYKPANGAEPFLTRIHTGLQSSADQCQILHNGCNLSYDEIMAIAESGQVLIEADHPVNKANIRKDKPSFSHDDEVEEKISEIKAIQRKKEEKRRKQQSAGSSPFLEIQPIHGEGSKWKPGDITEIQLTNRPVNSQQKRVTPNPIKTVPSKYGSPTSNYNVKKRKRRPYRPAPTQPYSHLLEEAGTPSVIVKPARKPTTTTEAPIFAKSPLDSQPDRPQGPLLDGKHVHKVNSTHSVVLEPKHKRVYRPTRTKVFDENGSPVSFTSVFSDVAGHTGGIHEFFDLVTFNGHPNNRRKKQFFRPMGMRPRPYPPRPPPQYHSSPPSHHVAEAEPDDDIASESDSGSSSEELQDLEDPESPVSKPAKQKPYSIGKNKDYVKIKSNSKKPESSSDSKEETEADEADSEEEKQDDGEIPEFLPDFLKGMMIRDKMKKEQENQGHGGPGHGGPGHAGPGHAGQGRPYPGGPPSAHMRPGGPPPPRQGITGLFSSLVQAVYPPPRY